MGDVRDSASAPSCRFCAAPLRHVFVDLGMSPLCQRHVRPDELGQMEPFFPLVAFVCERCFLVQLEEIVAPNEIFREDYAYFSSYSDSWLEHARRYSDAMVERFGLGAKSHIVELASNDGYLLQWFAKRGLRVLGIEPSANVAAEAVKKGVPSLVRFFGRDTARHVLETHGAADLIAGNNVLAHVPDINDFVGGAKILLAPGGVLTMEFPHLLRLVAENQFDTIYHEHFSYLSFGTVEQIFAHHGLRLFDVDEIPTHGGSLRIYGCHADDAKHANTPAVELLRNHEIARGLRSTVKSTKSPRMPQ
jgi:SAM-dependent methyltransferase